jgi:CheY-like chemotaxis protein
MRNPLAPLRTSLDILRAGNDKPAMQDKARAMMTRQLQQLTRLVDDLLDVSRITRGKAELARERVALATVVEEAVETLRPFIDACGHELTVSLPEAAIELQADPLRLTQIVGNLLNNAAKYTSKGGQIMLAARCDGFWAIITVRDNGVGLTSNQCDGVFDMFAQFDRSEQAVGGLGIGLTLVKQLVELHGGTVAAHSDGPGCGCEFTVRLPLAPEESEPAPPPASSGGRRILVADDNTDAAQALALLLELSGHEVRTAADGEAALSVAAEFTPEIVLLDIGMPVLDGLETAYRMRAEPWGADIIHVAVSGWGADTDRDRSTAAGFDHHLVKPVEPETLEALLAEL